MSDFKRDITNALNQSGTVTHVIPIETSSSPCSSTAPNAMLPATQETSVISTKPLPAEEKPQLPAVRIPDAREAAKQIVADNNLYAAMHTSAKKRDRAQREIRKAYEIEALRQQLAQRQPAPLPCNIQVDRPFPLNAFPEFWQSLIIDLASGVQAHLQLVAATLIGMMFIAARGNFKIVGDWEEPLTGYVVPAAHSGERKSAVLEYLKAPFIEFEKQIRIRSRTAERQLNVVRKIRSAVENRTVKECAEESFDLAAATKAIQIFGSEDAEIDRLEADVRGKLPFSRILDDLPTMEALPESAAEGNEAIGIAQAEGGFFLHRLRPSNDTFLLSGHDAEPNREHGRTFRSPELQAPCVSMCIAVQPIVLKTIFTAPKFDKLHEDGFLARLLVVFVPKVGNRCKTSSGSLSRSFRERYEKHITTLLNIERPPGAPGERTFRTILVPEEARQTLNAFRRENESGIAFETPTHGYASFLNRRHGHALRLAGVLHMLEHEDPQNHQISLKTMEGGIELAKFFDEHARVAFATEKWRALELCQKILMWVKEEGKYTVTTREVHRHVGGGRGDVNQIYKAFDILKDHGYIKKYKDGNKMIAIINPLLHDCGGSIQTYQPV
jgi:hypothetical protein